MLGKGRGFRKKDVSQAIDELKSSYERLIYDHALNPALLESLEDRHRHAMNTGRDPDRFLEEEIQEYKRLESNTIRKEQAESLKTEAKRRRLAGESFADKVLDEYRQRIEHYPEVSIHPDADPEVSKLYGAMGFLDNRHWGILQAYLRRAFPQAGQLDRMSIEQRFWRFVATRAGRLPEELERYRRALTAPSATKKEKIREAQEAMKLAAFFLHDLLDVCERAVEQIPSDDDVDKAMEFVRGMINDFRLKELKRR